MSNLNARLSYFWSTNRSLTALLVFLVLTVFVAPVLHSLGYKLRLILDFSWSLMLLSGLIFLSGTRARFIAAAILVLTSLVIRWYAYFHPSSQLLTLSAFSLLLSMAFLVLVVLVQVFRDGPITIARVQGSVVVYLLLGLMWAAAYEIIAYWNQGAFKLGIAVAGTDQ